MAQKIAIADDSSSDLAEDQFGYLEEEDFELAGYLDDLHAQHEGSRGAEIRSMDESPEASVVRYSFWSIM